jgi:dihydrofolate synthase/folylpolyglutamate synthase
VSRDNAALRFLFELEFFGIKAGLDTIRALLSFLGNPERRYPSIHIAGTNGKGSTAAMIASILTASGYRTGLYTSPHLVDFTERIRIDGKPMPRGEVADAVRRLEAIIRKRRATFFEATTAIAFEYFAGAGVDAAVIETGLGGRWDATNVITPDVSVITNIGLDHTEYLGTTIRSIAFEKGGIIKRSKPCITGAAQDEALRVLQRLADSRGSELVRGDRASSADIVERSLEGVRVNLKTREADYGEVKVSLAGDHQARNAQLALLATERFLRAQGRGPLRMIKAAQGLASIRRNSGLHGRLELLTPRPAIIADVAHNPDGMSALSRSLRTLSAGNFLTVFGVMRDKEYGTMAGILSPLSRLTVAVRPSGARALETGQILREFHARGGRALDGGSVAGGMERALREARNDIPVLVTGSHYVVGEAMKFLGFHP